MKYTVQVSDRGTQDSPRMSPLLKNLLSPPVLYAVSLPPPRRKNGIWKLHTWVLIGFVSMAFLLFWFSFGSSSNRLNGVLTPTIIVPPDSLGKAGFRGPVQVDSTNHLYGVVFDAGSTGSRVHVFQLSRPPSEPNGSFALTDELFEHVQPGLSSYADHPDQAADSLNPLLQSALSRLPNGACTRTPVVLRATAGLRLLPSQKADEILSAVRQTLAHSCLAKSPNAVSILDGNQEGLYLWISLNFMTKRISHSPNGPSSGPGTVDPHALDRTVGTVDLGGGSTQITFAPRDARTLLTAPNGFATDVQSGQVVKPNEVVHGRHVYSQSYLGLGLMSARYSMLHTITKRLPTQLRLSNELYSPCLPQNVSVSWSHAGRDWTVKQLPLHMAKDSLLGTELDEALSSLQSYNSSEVFNTCFAHALQVLRDPIEGDHAANVYPPSGLIVHRADEVVNQDFYAFSYVFDLATNVGLVHLQSGQRVSIAEFRNTADRVCRNPPKENPFLCMDLAYVVALLHNGYGFPWNKTITLQKKVDSYEISWGLGALFAEMSALNLS